MAQLFIEGNEAVAYGAVKAGCRFFAGYPITPATTIYQRMLELLPQYGGICLQGEDEIASIGYCLGASMSGLKALTATSGPGISLYSEQISFAVGSEIPIVIVNVQRLGPSTGSATRGADGDIQFMRWGNSGGLPVIVLAPVDAQDCYTLAVQAFNLAEQYRCPVFLASNKEIGMTRESVDLDEADLPAVYNRRYAAAPGFLPFQATLEKPVPDFLPIGSEQLVRQTSSTHGADGYITTDADEISATQRRLTDKLQKSVNDFSYHQIDGQEGELLLITYGVTARAAKEAADQCRRKGRTVSVLILKTLWPVPVDLIRRTAKKARRVAVVEMNLGQYVREIQRVLPEIRIGFLGQMDGRLITPEQIEEMICHE